MKIQVWLRAAGWIALGGCLSGCGGGGTKPNIPDPTIRRMYSPPGAGGMQPPGAPGSVARPQGAPGLLQPPTSALPGQPGGGATGVPASTGPAVPGGTGAPPQ